MSPPDEERFVSAAERLIIRSHKILDGPVTWFRSKLTLCYVLYCAKI